MLNSLIVELKQKVEAMKDQVARRETELSSGLNSQQQRVHSPLPSFVSRPPHSIL